MSSIVTGLIADEQSDWIATGDNFFVDLELSTDVLQTGTRVRLGEVILKVTSKPHLACKKFSERFGDDAMKWLNLPQNRDSRLRGVYCEVLSAGVVTVGDPVKILLES